MYKKCRSVCQDRLWDRSALLYVEYESTCADTSNKDSKLVEAKELPHDSVDESGGRSKPYRNAYQNELRG
jgi:hypothetical protein